MNLVAAVDQNWGLGKDGKLLFRVLDDRLFLRRLTSGGVLVMGRRTFESLPEQKPLPGRVNIVLSSQADFHPPGVTVCRNLAALDALLADYPPQKMFVFGGASVYRQLLPRCKTAYITQFYAARPHDCRLPRLDRNPEWRLVQRSAQQASNRGLRCSFDVYSRTA